MAKTGAVAIMGMAVLLCACSVEEASLEGASQVGEGRDIFVVTRQDQKTEAGDAEEIHLDECGGMLRITEGGDYLLHGRMEGQIVIEAYEDELVHLYLAGVEVTSAAGPAVSVSGASKLIMTLVSDTDNVLSDSANYEGYEETQGCLYSVADLTVNGDGTLYVYGYHEDGIRSKDRVRILDSVVGVQAKGDGIRGNDGVVIKDASVNIESEGNGIRTANRDEGIKGIVEICGGSLGVTAGRNGIYAANDVYIKDCVYNIHSVEEQVRTEGTGYTGNGSSQ